LQRQAVKFLNNVQTFQSNLLPAGKGIYVSLMYTSS